MWSQDKDKVSGKSVCSTSKCVFHDLGCEGRDFGSNFFVFFLERVIDVDIRIGKVWTGAQKNRTKKPRRLVQQRITSFGIVRACFGDTLALPKTRQENKGCNSFLGNVGKNVKLSSCGGC